MIVNLIQRIIIRKQICIECNKKQKAPINEDCKYCGGGLILDDSNKTNLKKK